MSHDPIIESLKKYVRAANYITAAQLYLQDNFLLTRPLRSTDIKPRLLGHWGTCPGINFIYAQLNYLVRKHQCSTLFILGPGHGFPALQAHLFIEETLATYYPQATLDKQGIAYICRNFSWPYGFPSHTNPGTPGALVEGGELGYALASAYGTILDNPDLLTVCVIGDGEAETAATAAAWHLNKFIDPAQHGTILPILHLNGYKISGPTIFGRMSKRELTALFTGYGYYPLFVKGAFIYEKMRDALEEAYQHIDAIKQKARQHKDDRMGYPRFPIIILETPKGWTGIKKFDHKKIEGNSLSHQIVLPDAKTKRLQLKALEKWLRSYHFEELFHETEGFSSDITQLLPPRSLRMGNNKHAISGAHYKELALPDVSPYTLPATPAGASHASSMRTIGAYLAEVFVRNAPTRSLRLFSPDELYSNKLDAIASVTPRAFMLPLKPWDTALAPNGQIIEILSEQLLQGLAQGYILTGRHALFASYEAFIDIVTSMAEQYAKFLKGAQSYPWRGDCASLIYILTSSGWRQEHNGFSHQNPSFAENLLKRGYPFITVYFPADANSTLVALKNALKSKNGITLICAGKTDEPCWLSCEEAEQEHATGLMIWDFASDPNPDLVITTIGDYVTREALAAVQELKTQLPSVRIRLVNIMTLTSIQLGNKKLSDEQFAAYFTADKPVIITYNGYADFLKMLLFDYPAPHRFFLHGYHEEGSTTTPFDMHIRNKTSRYHLIIEAAEILQARQLITAEQAQRICILYEQKISDHTAYIQQYGIDPQDIREWLWKPRTSS